MEMGKTRSQNHSLLVTVFLTLVFLFYGAADFVDAEEGKTTNNYTITFHENEGYWIQSMYSLSLSCYADHEIQLPDSNDVKRYGYELLGWTETIDGDNVLTDKYTASKDVTLYAKWKKNPFVTFDLLGGSWKDEYVEMKYGNGILVNMEGGWLPEYGDVIRDGYTFRGWSVTPDGEAIDYDYEPVGDTTIYAKWAEKHTLIFDLNGGKWKRGYSESYEDGSTGTKGLNIIILPTEDSVERDGYAFLGWTTKNGSSVIEEYDFIADATVYAKWEKGCTITYNLNGGKWDYSNHKETIIAAKNSEVVFPRPTFVSKDGYVLVGWSTRKNGSIVPDGYRVKKDVTL